MKYIFFFSRNTFFLFKKLFVFLDYFRLCAQPVGREQPFLPRFRHFLHLGINPTQYQKRMSAMNQEANKSFKGF